MGIDFTKLDYDEISESEELPTHLPTICVYRDDKLIEELVGAEKCNELENFLRKINTERKHGKQICESIP